MHSMMRMRAPLVNQPPVSARKIWRSSSGRVSGVLNRWRGDSVDSLSRVKGANLILGCERPRSKRVKKSGRADSPPESTLHPGNQSRKLAPDDWDTRHQPEVRQPKLRDGAGTSQHEGDDKRGRTTVDQMWTFEHDGAALWPENPLRRHFNLPEQIGRAADGCWRSGNCLDRPKSKDARNSKTHTNAGLFPGADGGIRTRTGLPSGV